MMAMHDHLQGGVIWQFVTQTWLLVALSLLVGLTGGAWLDWWAKRWDDARNAARQPNNESESAMDETERLIVQRDIAALIDHPSVYMGGSNRRSLKLANEIIVTLEAAGRLRSAQCRHAKWQDYKSHGTHCPTCGLQVVDAE